MNILQLVLVLLAYQFVCSRHPTDCATSLFNKTICIHKDYFSEWSDVLEHPRLSEVLPIRMHLDYEAARSHLVAFLDGVNADTFNRIGVHTVPLPDSLCPVKCSLSHIQHPAYRTLPADALIWPGTMFNRAMMNFNGSPVKDFFESVALRRLRGTRPLLHVFFDIETPTITEHFFKIDYRKIRANSSVVYATLSPPMSARHLPVTFWPVEHNIDDLYKPIRPKFLPRDHASWAIGSSFISSALFLNHNRFKDRVHILHDLTKSGLKLANYGRQLHNVDEPNRGNYPSHAGHQSKRVEMAKYKFTFAFENEVDVQGAHTFKVYDAWLAGTVPVYYGPSSISDYAPGPQSYIDVRNFASTESLAKYLVMLDGNMTAYMAYHHWRLGSSRGKGILNAYRHSLDSAKCRLCLFSARQKLEKNH